MYVEKIKELEKKIMALEEENFKLKKKQEKLEEMNFKSFQTILKLEHTIRNYESITEMSSLLEIF
ncbi:hypothetical protein [Bulleidia sp. zg-1006]|uniref:hypothetical protein n=1 Tax=Bulleidia sp. zg-1006 TaxID=2806552 RepID=UPI00193A1AE5|nr:hypothetical protein [Bulleidia sp. zg-1006]QRG86391.1 hypothetical protein JOS54_05925 [Bulleidia sp. zg-1006]